MTLSWIKERLRRGIDALLDHLIVTVTIFVLGACGLFIYNLFDPPTSSVIHEINELEPGVPGYTFITQALTEISSEMENNQIRYTESEFRNMRVCKAPRKYDSRPRGERYLDDLIDDLDGCIRRKREYQSSGAVIDVTVDKSSINISEVQRNNNGRMETLLFCSCPQTTIDAVTSDARHN